MTALPLARRRLGPTGPDVPVVGIGCNAFGTRIDEHRVREIVDVAIDLGVDFFDTADVYGSGASEELLGRALVGRREAVVVATKFGMDFEHSEPSWGSPGSRTYVRRAVEGSLRRLRTDRIDLYQLHQPDPGTPILETMTALQELVDEGVVGAYGCSNFSADEVREAADVARANGLDGFTSAQNEYSLYNREAESELVPALDELGLSLLPYFPLAYGLLTGKYTRGHEAPEGTRLALAAQARRLRGADFDRIEALEAFARLRGRSILEVAIGGLAAQPTVGSVIAGVSRPEQVESNARAGLWVPSDDDLQELDTINRPTGEGTHASYRRS